MRRPIDRWLRRAAALALALLVAAPDAALAADSAPARTKSLDSMSQSEIDALVSNINQQANWRMARRPNDPPDFVPGKPVRVMHGAGSTLGRGGRGGGRSFRQAGLSGRRGNNKRNGNNQQSAMDRGRNSSRNSNSSSGLGGSNRSSFGSGSRSSFGSGSSFGNGSSFGGSSFGSGSGLSNGMNGM